MRIRIPVGYEATVLAPRKRNTERMFFSEFVEADIPELDDGDAPIAVQWIDNGPHEGITTYHSRDQWPPVPEDGQMHTRWYDGGHFWPVILKKPESYPGDKGFRVTGDMFAERVAKGETWPMRISHVVHSVKQRYPEGRPLHDEPLREIIKTDREEVMGELRAQLNDYIIVDGQLHQRLPEPTYVLKEVIYIDNDPQMVIQVLPNDPKLRNKNNDFFRIDRFDEALDRSFPVKRKRPADISKSSINLDRRANIFISESIGFDDDSQIVVEAAQRIIDMRKDTKLEYVSRDEGISYLNLRDTLNRYESEDADIAAIVECLQAYSLSIEDKPNDWVHNILNRALKRWNEQPIKLG